ncbi:DH domain-containing protein [Aphelenchoides besseyi]|nr:DH domain-containing protein [Aphelenchoides besseyi]KAI6210096.1 DH domain-containing protein [Aphelenchoides besseyi]
MNDFINLSKGLLQVTKSFEFRPQVECAIRCRNVAALQQWIQLGYDLDQEDEQRNTVVHYACKYGTVDVLRCLERNRANFESKNRTGFTPFLVAVAENHVDLAEWLVEQKQVDHHVKNAFGKNAMWIASKKNHKEMIEFLLHMGHEMEQVPIRGYAENLRMLGPLRLQTECEIFTFKRKSRRLGNKPQKRHLFLFDGGVLFCKRRAQPLPYSSEFYEHKFCIPIASLGFAECSKSAPDRFELWDETKSDGYAVYTTDERARANWINKLAHITVLNAHHQQQHSTNKQPRLQHQNSQQQSPAKPPSQPQTQSSASRPHSWTSDSTTVSSRSSTSAFDDASSTTHTECIYTPDSNGNHANPMDGSHSTCTSISSGSRRSSTTAGSVDDNNSTVTPSIHTSKSLQNAAINGARELVRETAVSEV